jgi:hypothetical protein
VGGAQRRPLILPPWARFPASQNEVRAKDFSGNDLFSKRSLSLAIFLILSFWILLPLRDKIPWCAKKLEISSKVEFPLE